MFVFRKKKTPTRPEMGLLCLRLSLFNSPLARQHFSPRPTFFLNRWKKGEFPRPFREIRARTNWAVITRCCAQNFDPRNFDLHLRERFYGSVQLFGCNAAGSLRTAPSHRNCSNCQLVYSGFNFNFWVCDRAEINC